MLASAVRTYLNRYRRRAGQARASSSPTTTAPIAPPSTWRQQGVAVTIADLRGATAERAAPGQASQAGIEMLHGMAVADVAGGKAA